jgi:hypothetical protein
MTLSIVQDDSIAEAPDSRVTHEKIKSYLMTNYNIKLVLTN